MALLISAALHESGKEGSNVLPASTLSTATETLKHHNVNVVLLDLFLPDGRGLESLLAIRRESADVPVVVLTGLADEQTAIESLLNGAQDYLVKGTPGNALARSIRHAIYAPTSCYLGTQRKQIAVGEEFSARRIVRRMGQYLSQLALWFST